MNKQTPHTTIRLEILALCVCVQLLTLTVLLFFIYKELELMNHRPEMITFRPGDVVSACVLRWENDKNAYSYDCNEVQEVKKE